MLILVRTQPPVTDTLTSRESRLGAGQASLAPGVDEFEAIDTAGRFNQFCQRENFGYHLVRDAKGNFIVRNGDANILQIPVCDEKIAAWCAYCFVAGLESVST